MEFREIEDSKAYVEQLLAEGAENFTAVKKENARIIARQGVVGETIDTYTNTVEYFEQNAVPAEKEGVYRQKQVERTFLTISEDISITPSWGGSMQLPAGSHLNISNLDDIYGVSAPEFDQTYDRTGEQAER